MPTDRVEGLVDVPRLTRWLGEHFPGPSAPLEVTCITAGASSELFELRRGDQVAVLRRPAKNLHDPEAFNKIMLREHRVLTALEQTRVPHPKPLAVCDDPSGSLSKAIFLGQLMNGAAGPGMRPVIADTRIVAGQLAAIEVYCPDELEDFKSYVSDLKYDDVADQ